MNGQSTQSNTTKPERTEHHLEVAASQTEDVDYQILGPSLVECLVQINFTTNSELTVEVSDSSGTQLDSCYTDGFSSCILNFESATPGQFFVNGSCDIDFSFSLFDRWPEIDFSITENVTSDNDPEYFYTIVNSSTEFQLPDDWIWRTSWSLNNESIGSGDSIETPALPLGQHEICLEYCPGSPFVQCAPCKRRECQTINVPEMQTSIHESFNSLQLFPNPFSDHVIIESFAKELFNLKVYNTSAQLLLEKKNCANNQRIYLDEWKSNKSGIYFFVFENDNKVLIKKMIKK